MTLLRCIILLQFATALALSQTAQQSQPANLPKKPEALVQSLYRQVVARKPVGIPYGTDMKIFAPYLSKTLLDRIELGRACGNDWYRQHPGRRLKPPFAWLEAGLFSGANERTDPLTFQIERTETEKDGSVRVYVRLSGGAPSEKPWSWEVAALVVREDGHFVIDDVIYLKGKELPVESRLRDVLAKGCDGPRWVGYDDRKDGTQQ